MIALLRVELTRLRWRRAVWLLLLAAVVVPTIIFAARVWDTRPVDTAEIVQDNYYAVDECVDHPRRYGVPKDADDLTRACEEYVGENYGWYEPLTLAAERSGSGLGVVAVLTAILFLLGTTFVGHDWNSGSMSNQLLFEPRRLRIWTAKGLVVTLVSFVTAAAVSTAYWLGVRLVMSTRDLSPGPGAMTDSIAFGLRGAAFAAAAALGGYALTMLFRSTVATIGVLFVVSVAGGIFVSLLGVSDRWQPTTNVAAIVNNGTTYWVETPESCWSGPATTEEGGPCDPDRELPLGAGLVYWAVPLVVGGAVSAGSFRRRDVP